MIEFYTNDYGTTCQPEILAALQASAGGSFAGYGLDTVSERAAELFRELCAAPDAAVHFLPGGTGTNSFFIAAALKPYEAVISPLSGHIQVHETGAVEAHGRKILTVETGFDGKLTDAQFPEIKRLVAFHGDEHMVKPAMLYISQTTERGGVYSLAELKALRSLCDELGLYLFVDGARLAVALEAEEADVSLPDLARLSDAFYFGGTKAGLLYGEALMVLRPELNDHLRYHMKRSGQMMAKGFNLGIQFEAFFEQALYVKAGKQAMQAARSLSQALVEAGYQLTTEAVSNQIFVTVHPEEGKRLEAAFGAERTAVLSETEEVRRFVTHWQSPQDAGELLQRYLQLKEGE